MWYLLSLWVSSRLLTVRRKQFISSILKENTSVSIPERFGFFIKQFINGGPRILAMRVLVQWSIQLMWGGRGERERESEVIVLPPCTGVPRWEANWYCRQDWRRRRHRGWGAERGTRDTRSHGWTFSGRRWRHRMSAREPARRRSPPTCRRPSRPASLPVCTSPNRISLQNRPEYERTDLTQKINTSRQIHHHLLQTDGNELHGRFQTKRCIFDESDIKVCSKIWNSACISS